MKVLVHIFHFVFYRMRSFFHFYSIMENPTINHLIILRKAVFNIVAYTTIDESSNKIVVQLARDA